MSVPRNEEVRQLPLSLNHSSAIPIKKRRFPIIPAPSSPPEGKSSCSVNNRKDTEIPNHGLPLVASGDGNSSSQSDLSKKSSSVVTNLKFELKQTNDEVSASKLQDVKPSISFGTADVVPNNVDKSSTIESVSAGVHRNRAGSNLMMVKKEIVSEQSEDRCELELSSISKNIPLVDAGIHQNFESFSGKSHNSNLSLLSSVSREETANAIRSQVCANRSSWDLNTTMDEWEGSTCNDSFINKSADVSVSVEGNNSQNLKSSSAVAGVMGLSLNKGIRMSEGTSYSSHSPLYSSRKNMPDDSLGLSLAMPGREFDSKSSLAEKSECSSSGPKLKLRQVHFTTKTAIISTPKAVVKSEPVDESSKNNDLGTSSNSSTMGFVNLSSIKRETAEKNSPGTALTSSMSHELVNQILVKSELVETNKDVGKSNGSMPPRSDGKVMQHQESSASSSPSPMVLTPPSSCPSRLLNCSKLTISEELSNQSFHCEDAGGTKDILGENIASEISVPAEKDVEPSNQCEAGSSNAKNCNSTGADASPLELHQNSVDMDISEDTHEEDSTISDGESHQNRSAVTPVDARKKLCKKEDGEFEEGEVVRESLRRLAEELPIAEGEKNENLKMVECDDRRLQPLALSDNQSINGSDFDTKAAIPNNLDETHKEQKKEWIAVEYENCPEGESSQKSLEPEVDVNGRGLVGVCIEKKLEVSEQKVVEISTVRTTDGAGTRQSDGATDEVVKEICSSKPNLGSPKIEACINDNDAVKECSSSGNKSRIIHLPRASFATTPGKTRSIPNRLTSRSGKERYSDLDGEMRQRWKRDEIYNDGLNKFGKDKFHDPSYRNSRPSFMLGKGRISGRFGPSRNEWDSNHEYVSENYNGTSDYRIQRHKHPSSVANAELEYNGYSISSDVIASGSDRRKVINDDRFMRQIPGEVMDPNFARPQTMYDGIDGQHIRGNRTFSAMHRKGYSQIHSKSPIRSRTRSPSPPWPSRWRRSPDELQELNHQRRSPGFFRMRRTRSPDRGSFRDDPLVRRRGSPPFIPRHPNEFREMESGRDHVYPRPINSNRRSPPPRVFPRNVRRSDALDSREREEAGMDERRKFIEGRGGFRPFQQGYNGETDNMSFFVNEGPPSRPFRYCPDSNVEFFEKNNIREREFDGRMNQQSLGVPKRIRNLEEQQDGNYGSGSRVWHNDGFADAAGGKRRRF